MSFHFTDIEELDICNRQVVSDYLDVNPVKFIVNCAAYTAVDQAEKEAEKAMVLNAEAVDILSGESVRSHSTYFETQAGGSTTICTLVTGLLSSGSDASNVSKVIKYVNFFSPSLSS